MLEELKQPDKSQQICEQAILEVDALAQVKVMMTG
jgi:hypothetical protein